MHLSIFSTVSLFLAATVALPTPTNQYNEAVTSFVPDTTHTPAIPPYVPGRRSLEKREEEITRFSADVRPLVHEVGLYTPGRPTSELERREAKAEVFNADTTPFKMPPPPMAYVPGRK